MKTIALLTLSVLSGAGCAQTTTAPVATVAGEPAIDSAGAPKTATGNLVLVNETEIRRLRANEKVAAEIIKVGTKQLDYVASPVADMAPAPHYDAKGVNPNAKADPGKALAADALVAYRAGLCYLLTDDARFAANAQRIIDAWATTMTDVTTQQGKFNVSSNMPFMILAASWVRGANNWDSSAFDKFLPAVVLPASTAQSSNNHGFWGILMESSAYAYLGDKNGLDKAHARWNELMRSAVAADGAMIEEVERSATNNWRGGPDKGIKGLAYTHYALLPASLSAKIFAEAGQPVWKTAEGQLLKSAFARAASWTRNPATFPYYASNNGKLKDVRNAAYFALLDNYYPNKDAEAVLNDGEKVGLNGFYLLELFGSDAS